MSNRLTAQILSFTLLFPATIFAQETEEPKFTNLKQGECAPFDGTLFNPPATAQLITENRYAMTECDLRVEYEIKKTQAEMNLQLDTLQISYESLSEKHNLLMDIKNSEIDTYREMALSQPNKNNHWWLAGGVVVGIGLSLGTFHAATEISK
jgi:hypothetical protein|tara:strand:- start:165 stop:620 length:456 start_codon:yes stop_codon:yes gene_type:complete